jgi:hypothetical protein
MERMSVATAISSDLVAAFAMRRIGAAVHLRAGTVNLRLVRWMVLGSVPCAFLGARRGPSRAGAPGPRLIVRSSPVRASPARPASESDADRAVVADVRVARTVGLGETDAGFRARDRQPAGA